MNKNKKTTWLKKWDFNIYNFNDLDREVKGNSNDFGINYGRYVDSKDKNAVERLKNETPQTLIKEGDDIFIMFDCIPGASNQIYLKLSGLIFKDENGQNFVYDELNENSERYGKTVRYIVPKEIEWVLNVDDRLQFTLEGLNKKYNKNEQTAIKERPGLQEIKNKTLIKDLNDNLIPYETLIKEMKKIDKCFLTELYDNKSNHELFSKRQNMPYIEQHHFILQEKYKNYIKSNSKDTDEAKFLYNLIYSPVNLIILCPRCHRKIHHGTEKDVNEMINILLKEKNGLLENTKKIAKILKYQNYKELINEIYNINFIEK